MMREISLPRTSVRSLIPERVRAAIGCWAASASLSPASSKARLDRLMTHLGGQRDGPP